MDAMGNDGFRRRVNVCRQIHQPHGVFGLIEVENCADFGKDHPSY